ncbi:MAG: phage late control D family protein [Christensenellales bacterium]|jgi:hypothetical protein
MKIIYEGKDIFPDTSVNACYHDMYAGGRSDELYLRFNDTKRLWDIWSPKQNDNISVEYGKAKTGLMHIESVIPENGFVTLHAFSTPQTVKDKSNKSWDSVMLFQLIQEVAGRHGLGVETYGFSDQQYEYVAQNNTPDFVFLQQRCLLEGAAFLVYDNKLVVYGEAYMENQPAAGTIEISTVQDFTYQDNVIYAYGNCEVANSKFTGEFSASNNSDKKLRRVLQLNISNQAEANRFAKGLLRSANKDMTAGTIWLPLKSEYAAGSVANLETHGEKSWDGQCFITRIRHDYSREKTKLFFRKPLEGY